MSFFRVIKNVLYIYLVAKNPENKLFLVEIFYKEYLFYLSDKSHPKRTGKVFIRNGKIFLQNFELKIFNPKFRKSADNYFLFKQNIEPVSLVRHRRWPILFRPECPEIFRVGPRPGPRRSRPKDSSCQQNIGGDLPTKRNQNLVSFYLTEKYR